MSKLFYLTILLGFTAAETCRKFYCENLDSKICAVVNANNVAFNQDGGECCWLTAYRQVISQYDIYLSNTELNCNGDSSDNDEEEKTTTVVCASDANKRLASGSYPKSCTSSTDCELLDGTFGTCTCSSDGTYYCKPKIQDPDYFAFFYEKSCKDGQFTVRDDAQQIMNTLEEMAVDREQLDCYDDLIDAKYWKQAQDGDYEDEDLASSLALLGILAYVF